MATATTITTGGTLSGAYPPPTTTNLRGATPCYDCHSATVGQHHTPPTTGEQSRGCKTLSVQWKNRGSECVY